MSIILNFFQDYALTFGLFALVALLLSNLFPVTYRFIIQIICLIVIVTAVYLKGSKDERVGWELKEEKLKTQIATTDKERSQITARAAAMAAKNSRLVVENGTLRNINDYLSKQDIDGCVIPDGFVRLHNESAKGKLSGSTGESNGSSP